MGFRFFRRIGIAPGVGLNLGSHGASVSLGPRGMKLTFSPRGVRATLGIPGTGVFYSVPVVTAEKRGRADLTPRRCRRPINPVEPASSGGQVESIPQPAQPAEDVESNQHVMSNEPDKETKAGAQSANTFEQAILLDYHGNSLGAFETLVSKQDDPAAQFGAAAIAFKNGQYTPALDCAERAYHLFESGKASNEDRFTVTLNITEEVALELAPGAESALLLTAEILQAMREYDHAISVLRQSLQRHGDDTIVKLSLVELLYDTATNDRSYEEVIQLARRVEPTDLATIGLLLYKARALSRLGMHEGIPDLLAPVVDAGDQLPDELMLALRYELGRAYEALNKTELARTQYQRVYAIDAEYENVAARVKKVMQRNS